MICGFTSRTVRALSSRQPVQDQPIFGTWDFKWPLDKKLLRVAFQRPAAGSWEQSNFEKLVSKVVKYATTWQSMAAAAGAPAFDFVKDPYLPAPGKDGQANASRSELAALEKYLPYDVLVSFTPLPIAVGVVRKVRATDTSKPALWTTQTTQSNIRLPTAQLGRFAERVDYGTPTVYLGMPNKSEDAAPLLDFIANEATQSAKWQLDAAAKKALVAKLIGRKGETRDAYFAPDAESSTQEFEATIVHEFGHVLGIPHLHQSPLARPRWRSLANLQTLITAGTGVEVDASFVRGQILLPHPSTRSKHGAVLFSDWTMPTLDDDADPVISAAMAHPLLGVLLADSSLAAIQRFVAPQPDDLAFLRAMYSP
jgi:hypothetical protein